jgi:hypothetical protein
VTTVSVACWPEAIVAFCGDVVIDAGVHKLR